MSRLTRLLFLLLLAAPAQASHELEDRDTVRGAEVYAENCASCHGVSLEGQPDWQTPGPDGVLPAPPHDENGHTWHHSNADLFEYTSLGGAEVVRRLGIKGFNSGMPGFGEVLSEEEIWDVLAYIRSTWPERIQDIQAGRNAPH